MICFMDQSFCASPKCRGECGRQFTDKLRERAIAWWGSESFPLCTGYYCDDEGNSLNNSGMRRA